MTPEQILEDISSDRVKKVIVDTDTFNEMDDQYAVAYSIASGRIEVLAINAAPFHNTRSADFADGMEKSYDEIMRVLAVTGMSGKYPVFRGSRTRINDDPSFSPIDSPAARNIIRLAHETNEPIYVLSMGAITNVVSAFMLDPSIAKNVCVVWLGGNCTDNPSLEEFNLCQDYAAGQLLLDLDIPLVMLPAWGHGTCALMTYLSDLQKIKGDSPGATFFRKTLPEEHNPGLYDEGWRRIIWDIAAPGVLSVPDAFEFSVIPAPVFADDGRYAFDRTRRKIVYMEKVDRDAVIGDAVACLSTL
jgi:inosine-uridine nucleoside N-ribohydrolase